NVVYMGRSEDFLPFAGLADQRAVRRGIAPTGVVQRAGQANFRHQATVVTKSPAVDVMVSSEVVNVPQGQLLAVSPPVPSFVRQPGAFLVQHDHGLAFVLPVGIERLTAQTAGNTVFAGHELLHLLSDARAKIRGSWLAAIVGHEDFR